MNRKKLLGSKWTSVGPKIKEKHFVIIKVHHDESNPLIIRRVVLEAVLTKQTYTMDPVNLKNLDDWMIGWK